MGENAMALTLRTFRSGLVLAALLLCRCSSSQGGDRATDPGGTAPAASLGHRATYVAYGEVATAPPGTAVGDLIVAGVIGQGLSAVPPGWTAIGVTTACGPPDFRYDVYYAWRVREAGDGSYAFAHAAAVQLAAYTGADPARPIGAFQVARHEATSFELATLTASGDGDAAHYQSLGVIHGVFSPPDGYTERQDGADATTAGDRLGLRAGQATGGTVRCGSREEPLLDDGVQLHVLLRARPAS
jgi:hypothetical protein